MHIALARSAGGELWAVVNDQPTSLEKLQQYALRFSIKETFLDDKGNGFELELSRIRDEKKLERLCLVLSNATPFPAAQGIVVVDARL